MTVAVLSRALGRSIEVREPASPREIVRSRLPAGAPTALAEALLEIAALMRVDVKGSRTDTVSRLLGREPRTFAAWCARNAVAFG
ncbi:hypothetical protein AB0F91_30380 [Amycolatopsis sp. NPDC023774]|uniref:hypothetical protein n=1 Tax=Amycolatopsis sp. NPDC023774 TaxID=3155015 RepID=UPI0033C39B5F